MTQPVVFAHVVYYYYMIFMRARREHCVCVSDMA